ncbi:MULTISPECIES: AraC family transcriptional regulator [unclassified Cupriavidus]|uniref:AraC family transcriptional regulator n=1 Tax=unclassified Cupriavidus TaxID=2640874 RepID=UPI001C0020E6|nr:MULTISPECIES: AraC family transcriptional regulator [unclassified Cupriavidus]MCA3184838.1 AraC family transcriptional regulator [Cupriavidus sp.]MCA3189633.1 AraC family transcriptional regulator [Cupriavidus sp.]MCA3195729.1 AraC family transcriptional regulator [Cupriavidus sp.]MCA3203886.1 AraC family transcriptional regulator [Cupriavidus sp.]MCA3206153.1 AraC family transcriptional regulator [Cupriavidus sp.]
MDSLSELVRLLAPSGTVDLHCRVAGAWSSHNAQAAPGHVPYHAILDGQADVSLGADPVRVAAGDVLLFPHGAAHTLSGVHGGRTRAADANPETRHFNGVVTEIIVPGAEKPLDILCGTFVLGSSAAVLLRALPEMLCVNTGGNADAGLRWLRGLIGMMHVEADAPGPGSAAIIADLSTALFTVLLRTLIAQGAVSHGVMALMADARMAAAVDAVVRHPEKPWTVDSLAEVCNVSRATLARRFAQLGITPLELVTTLRMERAARLLRRDGLSAAAVAEQCGYASQAAFGRVFTQHFGVGPGAYRRQHRALRSARVGRV